jgi:hypothetical protein
LFVCHSCHGSRLQIQIIFGVFPEASSASAPPTKKDSTSWSAVAFPGQLRYNCSWSGVVWLVTVYYFNLGHYWSTGWFNYVFEPLI